ncbi:MAG: hypothetical protein KAW17_10755 [Candidatus Eisenbacteria sp.]|nr:hypothetical protein [Candidatus Eisenbacteria bacterium]
MAATRTTPSPTETEPGFESVEVDEIPVDHSTWDPTWVDDMAPLFDRERRDVKRPSTAGNVVFILCMATLGLWGGFLVLYLLKTYLGIDIFEGVSLNGKLGL